MIFLELFITFFVIGLFTFGGGYAMIPMMQEAVLSKGWCTLDDIYNFLAISESTPGVIAVNSATYIGYKTFGILGSIVATFAVTFPSFVFIAPTLDSKQ